MSNGIQIIVIQCVLCKPIPLETKSRAYRSHQKRSSGKGINEQEKPLMGIPI